MKIYLNEHTGIINGTGFIHKQKGLCCQDKFSMCENTDLYALVICDGAGFSPISQVAASEVSRLTGKILMQNFQRYLTEQPEQIRYEITTSLKKLLRSESLSWHLPEKNLACTIIAAARSRDNHLLCLHLGDGAIYWKEDNRYRFVSYPENDLTEAGTWLTMNPGWEKHLRIYRSFHPDCSHVLLLTDGIQTKIRENISLEETNLNKAEDMYNLVKIIRQKGMVFDDDFTMGMIL